MTIRNLEAFTAGLWDWGILDGCFGATKIRPTDLDGMIERRGMFLVLEAKGPGKDIPTGQLRTLRALCATDYFTVAVINGEPQAPERIHVMYPARFGRPDRVIVPATVEDLRQFVMNWYRWANALDVALAGRMALDMVRGAA